jgi:cell fate regulator YaaT (PSP1 superfamily)
MQEVVGVVFRRLGKVYHFDPRGLSLLPGDKVVVETQSGIELADVAEAPLKLEEEHIVQPLKPVVRRANTEDLSKLENNRAKEAEAFKYAKERIEEQNLAMQLFQVELTFDGTKMKFHFTAENRVDFRDLVKDLAGHFKTRIELRQIGVRDKAKMVGGLGHCGQNLCCSVFLSDLNPVSIRMAKEQDLSLNPIKISGVCGRLMCCLQYEYGAYKDFNKRAPGKGACVETCTGHKGCVVQQYPVKERLKIRSDEGLIVEVPLSDVTCVCGKQGARKPRDQKSSQNNNSVESAPVVAGENAINNEAGGNQAGTDAGGRNEAPGNKPQDSPGGQDGDRTQANNGKPGNERKPGNRNRRNRRGGRNRKSGAKNG